MEVEEKLALYIQEINNTPLLTFIQERELSKCIQARLKVHSSIEDAAKCKEAENSDSILGEAIETLSTHNLRLVIKEAFKSYRSTGVSVKDLIGSGNMGLIKAAYLYDSEGYNTRFSTYATYWIRQAMFEAIHSSCIVKVPVHILNGRHKHNKITENGDLSDDEVMEKMAIDEAQLKRIKDANISVISLNQEVSWHTSDGGAPATIGDFIPDENAVNPGESVENQDKYDYLYEAMEELDDMSKDIITAQILDDDKKQLRELGKKYGKTGERIRQIKEKALKALRKKIEYKRKYGSKNT